ncbi:MAG: DNA repair protein RadA [Holosporales bacterium]|jgi:DNA repair protein RadA/Sms|nr:DNA repair protein RadA [Holosporales bacterium]
MAKGSTTTRFVCQECGAVLPKWMGQCDICKAWNSVTEEVIQKEKTKSDVPSDFFKTIAIAESDDAIRHATPFSELNRVLGGGFVGGSVVLVGGPPGIGKSTLLLQILLNKIVGIENYIYFTAEESVAQIGIRAKRIGLLNNDLKIASTNSIEQIIASTEELDEKSIVVIDSIQTISTNIIQSSSGTISQVRYCTQELVDIAKKKNIIIVIVGHVTKDGAIAGPKTLEHMVDCVLYFEGDKSYDYRILRGSKNRFGATDEIGVFSMTGTGLEEVLNPSSAFLSDHDGNSVSGVAVFSGIEGTRPILSEIQALVSHTNLSVPRRASVGFDNNRLSMLVAVISNRCRLNFFNKDVYLNIAGGLRISEPAVDMAVVASIISAYLQKSLPLHAVFFGEVSLSGEIRQSNLAYSRMKEAQKLGFQKVFCSNKTDDFGKSDINLQIIKLRSVKQIFDMIKNSSA